ncbi:lysozyme inhibitor LprI family protein [Sphingomonas sp. ac-8]|uniref:lysozyme inhibitor LprI family protein n=1 Tax=Sphingomonas sp. ac-8 TaxID=3242977 RepID=UPI003A7F9CA8
MDLPPVWRHFGRMILSAFVLAAQAATLPHTGPSFDCTAAMTAVEQAVCDDPELSRLDDAMAAEYARALRKLSRPARAALIKDQRWFLVSQREWYANRERWKDFPDLASRFRSRTKFLASLQAGGKGWTGRWGNLAGVVTIRQSDDGTLSIQFSTAQPANARWLCDVDVRGRLERGRLTISSPHEIAGRLHITLEDGRLIVRDTSPVQDFYSCGMNGSVTGDYFAIGGPARSGR